MKTRILFISLLAAVLAARADDDMVIEVTQDFTVTLLENLPAKPYAAPALLPLPKAESDLSPLLYSGQGSISSLLHTLPAAVHPLSPAANAYPGYASLGYAPARDFDVAAGYRFVSKKGLGAALSGKYATQRYRTLGEDRHDMGTSELGIAADAYAKVAEAGSLSASLAYDRATALHPALRSWTFADNSVDARIGWIGTPSRSFTYSLSATLCHSAFSAPDSVAVAPSQTIVMVRGMAAIYVNSTKSLSLSVGVNAAFGAGTGFLPEATIAYSPRRSPFSVALSLASGKELNTIRQILALDPYLVATSAFRPTTIPVQATVRAAYAPIPALMLSASASYAKAKGALFPALYNMNWEASTLSGCLFTVQADYAPSSIIKGSVAYSHGSRWHRWADRAANTLDVEATLTPFAGLDITVAHSLRTGRHIAASPLRNLSNLSASATYQITDRLSATLAATNLLGRRAQLLSLLPEPPTRITASVGFRF